MLDSWDWKEQAACKHQQHIFYPKIVSQKTVRQAAEICMTCPVQHECKKFAEENKEEYGIWAGDDYSAAERKRIKKSKDKYYRRGSK